MGVANISKIQTKNEVMAGQRKEDEKQKWMDE